MTDRDTPSTKDRRTAWGESGLQLTATSPDPRIYWMLILFVLAVLTWGVYHGTA